MPFRGEAVRLRRKRHADNTVEIKKAAKDSLGGFINIAVRLLALHLLEHSIDLLIRRIAASLCCVRGL
jgi:hypothetical protein